jgi:ribosomal protein S8
VDELQTYINEYSIQLSKGYIQKAYKGIMTFMSGLKTHMENSYPDYIASTLYFGYLDMSYFAFTPSDLKNKKLKIAIVFLHEQGRFEVWLSGSNRKIQAEYIEKISHKNIGKYKLSKVLPGVDSIIESILVDKPDFNNPEELKMQIERKTIEFVNDITSILDE